MELNSEPMPKSTSLLIKCKRRPRGKSADQQSLLPRAQRDAQREWMKLRFVACRVTCRLWIGRGQIVQ